MLNALRQISRLLGQGADSGGGLGISGNELFQLANGKLCYLKENENSSLPSQIFPSCTLTIRKTSTPFNYQLVASDPQKLEDENVTLIDSCICFHKVSLAVQSLIAFKWKEADSNHWLEFSFDPNSFNKHTIDFFETSVLECMFERRYKKSHELASARDLEVLRYDPENPHDPLKDESPEKSRFPETSIEQVQGDILAVCTGDLHIYDPNTLNFVLLPDGKGASGSIIDSGKFAFNFTVSNAGKTFLTQPLDNSMNPVFSDQYSSFIWNFYNESTGLSYSWSLKFSDAKLFTDFREVFGKCMYETLNKEFFKKVKDEDQSYLVRAYADDVEMTDAEDENGSSEEEYFSEEENNSKTEYEKTPMKGDGGRNSLLAVGYKHNRSFVVRGDKIGVFSNDHEDVKYSTTINSIMTPTGKYFSPAKLMLHNQDSSMVLMNPSTPGSLFKMDLEVGKVVEEWKIDENRHIVDFTPDTKYSQLTPQQTFVGISHNALFRVDPRLSGTKLVDSQLNQYKSKNEFSCSTTTGKGGVVVASDKGDLRLYDKLEKRAKTHLPGLGDPIIGIDVSEDGKWILATCKTYLLLMNTDAEDGGNTVSGFNKSLGSKKPVPKRLQLKPEHVAWINEPLSFTPGRFNTGEDMEKKIVTSTGPYVITWNFRRVKNGHRYDYIIKKYPAQIVADQFQYGSDNKVIVALPDDVTLATKREFSSPQKLFTPTKTSRSRESIVNSQF